MKLDTAYEHMKIWAERASIHKHGFSVTLHFSPDFSVVIEKNIKVKSEEELNKLQNIIFE